jgi:hypothetical protein
LTLHTGSSPAAFGIEHRCGIILTSSHTRQGRVGVAVTGISRRKHSAPGKCENAYRKRRFRDTLAGRRQLANDLTSIRDKQVFSSPYFAEVLTQAILQFPDSDRFHNPNVASCGYIVK